VIGQVAGATVVLVGGYFCALGLAAFLAPALATRFLRGFAQSASTHYLELGIRIPVGAAFILRAPELPREPLFTALGWMIVISSLVLLVIPWRWHRQFAERVVPPVARYLRWLGVASLGLGVVVLWAAIRGSG